MKQFEHSQVNLLQKTESFWISTHIQKSTLFIKSIISYWSVKNPAIKIKYQTIFKNLKYPEFSSSKYWQKRIFQKNRVLSLFNCLLRSANLVQKIRKKIMGGYWEKSQTERQDNRQTDGNGLIYRTPHWRLGSKKSFQTVYTA